MKCGFTLSCTHRAYNINLIQHLEIYIVAVHLPRKKKKKIKLGGLDELPGPTTNLLQRQKLLAGGYRPAASSKNNCCCCSRNSRLVPRIVGKESQSGIKGKG